MHFDSAWTDFNLARDVLAFADLQAPGGKGKDAYVTDETTAEDTLKQNWSTYPATDKTDCVILEDSGGPASYVELLSCLEIIRDARGIRNADPLQSDPFAPVGTRRGKRK